LKKKGRSRKLKSYQNDSKYQGSINKGIMKAAGIERG
jgi:hypothetical protein